ncbi:MAG: hypothetical protein JXB07_02995 [Anaerolineae bacterium]|nr:hypothetical protein [Anaerolineae bacterium]
MNRALWRNNTPQRFWQCVPDAPPEDWDAAIRHALPSLGLSTPSQNIEDILVTTLGEGQFGTNHWQLSLLKRLYYMLKPLLPRSAMTLLKRLNRYAVEPQFPLNWPIEKRFVHFQYEIMRRLLLRREQPTLTFKRFWPDDFRYAFVLTHDVESEEGQALVRDIAGLDEQYGFRSSFNFVPERYPLDQALIAELKERGFEVGVHGLKHDGKLFSSYQKFTERAYCINAHLKEFQAVGFRAPMTHRHPEWLQDLDIEYDLSFFDTDPYEPLPGGTMSIWPFFIGHFVELPYTLPQDSTLVSVLGETSPRLWIEKVDFIEQYRGMVLVNTHPDYLPDGMDRDMYESFLAAMQSRSGYWHALPRDVARWWRTRSDEGSDHNTNLGTISLQGDEIVIQ